MNEAQALLAAILAAPDDDAPRLVYADWLDEYGDDPRRAEFIRVQCAEPHYQPTFNQAGAYTSGRVRCDDLLRGGGAYWLGQWYEYGGRDWQWVRGFVGVVYADAAGWLAHADAILAEHPVREVRLTTRFRLESDGPSVWFANDMARARFSVAAINAAAASKGGDVDRAIAEARWPGLAFGLPERPAYRQADFTPLFTGDPTSDA